MNRMLFRGGRRLITVTTAAVTALVLMAAPALATHAPVILDETDVLPWNAPLILDGTDAIGLLGIVPCVGAVRSAQVQMQAGNELELLYSIPDQAPENALSSSQLPLVLVVAPNGKVTPLTPDMRETVGEGGISVIMLKHSVTTAVTGTYSIVVIGRAKARFLVSVGPEGSNHEHGIARGEFATIEEVIAFFTTAP